MAPSPRKQPVNNSPMKLSRATPTKKTPTRSSPRKKVWASPPKAVAPFISTLFNEGDFSPLSNKSWAEITEEDEACNASLRSACEEERRSQTRRKAAAPKKLFETKPKFQKSLDLTNELFSSSSIRRSTRIRDKKTEVIAVTETRVVIEKESTTSRKRHLSTTSTVDEGLSPTKRRTPHKNEGLSGKPARKTARGVAETGKSPARVRLFNSTSTSSSVTSSPSSRKDHWEEPKLGWCTDEAVLARRNREIERAKEKPSYQRYALEVPLSARVKGVHPRTPNKKIDYSRRSWDQQIRQWKRSLYLWAGEEPSDSVNTSFCSYSSDDNGANTDSEAKNVDENIPVFANIDIQVRPETDAMASLLGKFDIDSRHGSATMMGDESTLKVSAPITDPSMPLDFSQLNQQ